MNLLCKDQAMLRPHSHQMDLTRREFGVEWERTMARWVPEGCRMNPHPFYQMAWIAFLAGKRSVNAN